MSANSVQTPKLNNSFGISSNISRAKVSNTKGLIEQLKEVLNQTELKLITKSLQQLKAIKEEPPDISRVLL